MTTNDITVRCRSNNESYSLPHVHVGKNFKMQVKDKNGKTIVNVDTSRDAYKEIEQNGKYQGSVGLEYDQQGAFSYLVNSAGQQYRKNVRKYDYNKGQYVNKQELFVDLDMKDLKNAEKLKGKHGVTKVDVSNREKKGIVIFTFNDGSTMCIDIETEAEAKIKEARVNTKADVKKKAPEQPKEPSLGDKIIDFLEDLFNGNL